MSATGFMFVPPSCIPSIVCLAPSLRGTANFVVKWQGAKKQATANIVEIKKVRGAGFESQVKRSENRSTTPVCSKAAAIIPTSSIDFHSSIVQGIDSQTRPRCIRKFEIVE